MTPVLIFAYIGLMVVVTFLLGSKDRS
jgi:hypothetical protein